MFLTTIAQTGRLTIQHPGQDPPNLRELLEEDVIERETAHRLDQVNPPPVFDSAACVWASGLLYRSCQFLVYRELDAGLLQESFKQELGKPADASVCYSVDVALCYLPDVLQLARGIASGDPLVVCLRELAGQWPLSSVGVMDLGEMNIDSFIDNTCLRTLYVQRIMERKDKSRLTHTAVRRAVREAVGAYHELAPELMAIMGKEETV